MKVVHVDDLKGIAFTGGTSYRAVLANDNMGFSVNKTVIPKGGPYHWHYKNHLEACYCIEGEGYLGNLTTKKGYVIEPGTVYVLDQNDDHVFTAVTDCVLVSIFNPPLTGKETHDENGVYHSDLETISQTNKFKAWEIAKAVKEIDNLEEAAQYVEDFLNNKI